MEKNIFTTKIKNLRKLHKLTQEKLAELVDIDVRQIARFEAGESLPSIPTLLKFCKTFNVSPNDLILPQNLDGNDSISDRLKSDIYDILSIADHDRLELIKKLILAVI